MTMPSRETSGAEIIEVTPRDGLQNEKSIVATNDKVMLIDSLIKSGARRIEAVSFVNPRLVPAMADAEAVMEKAPRVQGVTYAGLALNARGVHRAIAAGVDEINYVLPVTDAFAAANQNSSVEQLLYGLLESLPDAAAAKIPVTVTLAVAFGCPYEGEVSTASVLDVGSRLMDLASTDVAELALADTIGCGVPRQATELFRELGSLTNIPLRAHLHETRHTAIANTMAALAQGVRRFDSSVAGLGGCPFAPGAAGNVATEDLAWVLDREGFTNGVDPEAAAAVGQWISGIVGVKPRSGVASAGVFPPLGRKSRVH